MAELPENRMNDDLLGKFLAGETDPNESESMRRGLSESEADRRELERFSRIWEATARLKPDIPAAVPGPDEAIPVDTDAAWRKLKAQMTTSAAREPEAVVRPLSGSARIHWRGYWRAAAAVVLLIGIGWTVWQRAQPVAPPAQVAVSSRQETVERVLPDGSRVVLNKNSRLRFPAVFSDSVREVLLTGEAFFEVRPDATRPFRIRAKGATVQVLGTSFSIRAYDANVRVAVKTGSVQFAASNQRLVLKKDEQASYDAASDTIRRAPKLDPNGLAYQTGSVTFENDRLADVIRTLSETYRVEIRLGNARLADCRLTTRFQFRDTPDYVMTVTAETLGLRLRREGTVFILDGETCQ